MISLLECGPISLTLIAGPGLCVSGQRLAKFYAIFEHVFSFPDDDSDEGLKCIGFCSHFIKQNTWLSLHVFVLRFFRTEQEISAKIYPIILERINNKFASGMFSTIFERFTTKPVHVYDKFNAEYVCILFMHEISTKIDVENA